MFVWVSKGTLLWRCHTVCAHQSHLLRRVRLFKCGFVWAYCPLLARFESTTVLMGTALDHKHTQDPLVLRTLQLSSVTVGKHGKTIWIRIKPSKMSRCVLKLQFNTHVESLTNSFMYKSEVLVPCSWTMTDYEAEFSPNYKILVS